MASLHEDFYSDSSSMETDDGSVILPGTAFIEDYETSVTSTEDGEGDEYDEEDEEEEGLWGVSQASPLLPKAYAKSKHLSAIPHIVVTEPFEIGPDPTLQFSLYYDKRRKTLIVHLQKAFNLPVKDTQKETTNAFVIIYLLPNRETDRETYESRVVHNTRNPNFDEMFQFPRLKQDVARKQSLILRIYHQHAPKYNTIIGGVLQPLESENFQGKTIRKKIVEDLEEHQVCVCVYVCVCVCVCVCVWCVCVWCVCLCECVCMCMVTGICIFTFTCIHSVDNNYAFLCLFKKDYTSTELHTLHCMHCIACDAFHFETNTSIYSYKDM